MYLILYECKNIDDIGYYWKVGFFFKMVRSENPRLNTGLHIHVPNNLYLTTANTDHVTICLG